TPEGGNCCSGVDVTEECARHLVTEDAITVDGISLTVASRHDNVAEVAVIPYTYHHTNIHDRKPGNAVNLEGDVLGKYVERYLQQRDFTAPADSPITLARLLAEGF